MKTKLFPGKTGSRMLLISSIALLSFSACNKSEDKNQDTTVTAQEAGTVMAQAVDPETGGFALQTEVAANVALTANSSIFCGVRRDTTVIGAFDGGNRSFDYSLSLSRLLTCSGSAPSMFEYSFTGTGNYSLPSVTSSGNVNGSFSVTGFESGTGQLTLSQTYTYASVQQSHVGLQRTITSNVTVSSSNIKVDKLTRQIVSGTASINVTGSTSIGETFDYNGTVTFLGNRQATLAVEGGTTFSIQW